MFQSNKKKISQLTQNRALSLLPANSLRRKLFIAFVASLVAGAGLPAFAASPSQPKLVIGIVVDDLRTEYITLLREQFGEGGFNRLLRDGVFIPAADFGTSVDPTAATAIIYTGASPSVNGVPASETFDRATLRTAPVFQDQSVMGNYTNQSMSPSAMSATTISDEVRISGGGTTYSYSIAPDPSKAIVMASHAGNCAIWLNNANENWATSTYYKDVPTSLNNRNRLKSLKARMDTMSWSPLYKREKYQLLPEHITLYPFKYVFRSVGPDKMRDFTNSPIINQEVTNFAIETLNDLQLGSHSGSDMISLGYTLKPYESSKNADNRYELIDAYYRLDANLANLFSAIDKKVGLNNTLIFVTGTPASPQHKRDDEKWKIPYGEFSTKKAISLLNLYLIALHGNGDWVQAYHNGQFYLNRQFIEQRKESLEKISLECARFLEKMSGVTKAYSLDEIIEEKDPNTAPLKQSLSIERSGDVWVQVHPGWQIIDDFNNTGTRTDNVVRYTAATAPAFILAPNVEARKIDTPVDARAIAPTITSLLRIRSPNAASVPPLNLQ